MSLPPLPLQPLFFSPFLAHFWQKDVFVVDVSVTNCGQKAEKELQD